MPRSSRTASSSSASSGHNLLQRKFDLSMTLARLNLVPPWPGKPRCRPVHRGRSCRLSLRLDAHVPPRRSFSCHGAVRVCIRAHQAHFGTDRLARADRCFALSDCSGLRDLPDDALPAHRRRAHPLRLAGPYRHKISIVPRRAMGSQLPAKWRPGSWGPPGRREFGRLIAGSEHWEAFACRVLALGAYAVGSDASASEPTDNAGPSANPSLPRPPVPLGPTGNRVEANCRPLRRDSPPRTFTLRLLHGCQSVEGGAAAPCSVRNFRLTRLPKLGEPP